MKIIDNRSNKQVPFCHLPIGAVFQCVPSSPNFYMKTSSVDDVDGEIITNAVRLDNGLPHKFDGDTTVIKVDAELVLT